MKTLKYLLILTLIIASSCKEDVATEGNMDECYETFVIVNQSNHFVKIEKRNFYMDLLDEYNIPVDDSLMIQKINLAIMRPLPFNGNVFISFDNEAKSFCNLDRDIRNLCDPSWYETHKTEDGNLISRYIITEEDYEYAKDHPYVGEEE